MCNIKENICEGIQNDEMTMQAKSQTPKSKFV
jgi:hypothetical protein